MPKPIIIVYILLGIIFIANLISLIMKIDYNNYIDKHGR